MNSSDDPPWAGADRTGTAPASAPDKIVGRALLLRRQRSITANWDEVQQFLRSIPPELARAPFSVCVVSDRAIQRYNRRFRHKDETTDVLSFPADTVPGVSERWLGDIVISADTSRRNAARFGVRLEDEIKLLILHGLLHLLGYDHERDRGQMARKERSWATRLGLPQALLARQPKGNRAAASLRRVSRPLPFARHGRNGSA